MFHIFRNAQVYKFVTVRNRRPEQARNGARSSVQTVEIAHHKDAQKLFTSSFTIYFTGLGSSFYV